ncbi:MAG: hypothetical protein R2939_01510 [Kofleriaceae bacterium]
MTIARSLSCATLLATLAVGCADNDQTLVVLQAQAEDASTCVPAPSEGAAGITFGVVDVRADGYVMTPLLKNYADSTGSLEAQRRVLVEGARVSISFADDELFTAAELTQLDEAGLLSFETRQTAPVDPDGGLLTLGVRVIPEELLRAIGTKLLPGDDTVVLTNTTFFGQMGGGDITSTTFPFPVTACADCLINDLGACPLPAGTTPAPGSACVAGQNVPVDCCSDGAGGLVCPATVTPTT